MLRKGPRVTFSAPKPSPLAGLVAARCGGCRGRLACGLPRKAARETDSAVESPKGDVFGPETFALGLLRGRLVRGVP